MRTMDRHSKMAEIKLVSKYYPVANYSYPSPMSPTSPNVSRHDRSSVRSEDSEVSTPGLIDDRTDSEVSQEDDYQHHAHTTELWDSFWRPGGEWRLEHAPLDLTLSVKEDCKALAPSPPHKSQSSPKSIEANSPSWPLPSRAASTRKHGATYSAFPSIRRLPSSSSPTPLLLSPRSPATNTMAGTCLLPPPRPRRPDALLTPCLRQLPQVPAALTSPTMPPRTDNRPKTSSGTIYNPKRSMDSYFGDKSNIFGIHGAASRSSEDLTKTPSTPEPPRGPRHYKSTTYLGAARQQQRQQHQQQQVQLQQVQLQQVQLHQVQLHQVQLHQVQQQRAEPQSVFEEDSDCEETARLSFFRFHKRASSEKASAASQDAAALRKRRNRADTIPSPSTIKSPAPERERRVDVFGRMLGRRSR